MARRHPICFGPYEVLEMRGSNAARLELPPGCRLDPVFNLDLLKKYIDGRAEFPDRPARHAQPGAVPEEDPDAGGPGDPQYEAEAIIGSRYHGARRQYKVHWTGYARDDACWVSAADCGGCPELVQIFE